MKQLLTTGAVVAALTLASCKKNDNSTAQPDNPGTQPVLRLKKMIQTFNGNTKTINFSYANDGLLSGFAATDNSEQTSFAYDNNGNLVAVDETEGEFHNVYTYNYQDGKPATASFKSWKIQTGQANQLIEDDQLTYTVANNRVTRIRVASQMGGDTYDFDLTYNANGDVTQVKTVGSDFYTATFTYGTHKSAFPMITKWVLDQAGFSLHFYTRRDQTGASYDFPGTALDVTQTTSYTYNAAGYPATANSGGVQTTFEYEQ